MESIQKLQAISNRSKQLWVVIYVDVENLEQSLDHDLTNAIEGGADAVVLEVSKEPQKLQMALRRAREKWSGIKLGANYLGGPEDPYGFKTGFDLAKQFELDLVWTDFSGVDLIHELPEVSLHEIEAHRSRVKHPFFYCSGIHMKYGTLVDSTKKIENSALQALGWVDGLVLTASKTGEAIDPQKVNRVRSAVGDYPIGVASGVSASNVHHILNGINYCLVNTSVADPNHRVIQSKVRELRTAMGVERLSNPSV